MTVSKIMKLVWMLLLGLAITGHAGQIEGRVVAVLDGDTVTVLDADNVPHRIRLAGIDAPEKAQAFGQRSKQSLSELVFKARVVVLTTKKDRYGRQVGKILRGDDDVNLEQVRRGMAWFYRKYAGELSVSDRTLYGAAEAEARENRRGLWSDKNSVAPWEFRMAKRERASER